MSVGVAVIIAVIRVVVTIVLTSLAFVDPGR
jgi:hypothetical protein